MSSKAKGKSILLWVVGFFVVLFLVYFLFANTIIKLVLESKLGESYGAEVNIAEFDHSLFPTTVTLKGIALTNPTKPTHNQVLVGEANADVALAPLLDDEVIVNELNLLDVQFDTERASTGEVYRVPERSLSFDEIKSKAQEAVPSVDELLERNPLKTTAAIENAKAAYETYGEGLKTDYGNLPDKSRIDYYKTQVTQLKETNYQDPQALLQAKSAFDQLKEEMSADRARIADFTSKASNAKRELTEAISALKSAPQEDYALLKGVIAGDQDALSQVTYFVFGDKAAEYTEYLMSAMQIVMPLIQGEEKSEAPTEIPSILVKEANVSVLWQNEAITSKWNNITNVHEVFGSPTTFSIEAAGDLLKSFTSSGEFWIDSSGVDASQVWSLAGVNMSNVAFSGNDTLDAVLTSALMTTTGSMKVTDNTLTGTGDVDLQDLVMEATGSSDVTSAIANALQSLSSLSMTMLLDGTLSNPNFNIKSDLDNKLAQAALSQLTASQQDKLDELNNKLNSMISNEQSLLSGELVDVNSMLSAAQGDSEALQALLQTQLNSVVEQQKNKLFDKLKGKFGQGE
ncbi:MAG: TIGR03545 family protein [Alteromonas sp.]|uniref:TIGR03545 family protein n=1 Tax=Alteromonas australica TaxID=589873 RepID=UPI000C5A6EAE|nr:TIGR03545 family protein [Alteromonas australica]MAB93559.1 TIGR03545 family protein [Alteromonas sp.]MAF72317.1 TIGR03545 family protein [Alteromonas sp.]MAO29542.1 TIGR03545 family protein [Alteromonas sp.]MBU34570.1 TIGR03545 family protein [Alteromonas sp.]HAU26073.1 TIGR03545 family protein [Alteromonas australica]|tara:strand:- start:5062 stop:6777 length:1716 start_codon:yes stop_codon:yes gene_type:complete